MACSLRSAQLRPCVARLLGAALVLCAGPAAAYSTESVVSYACHEKITMQALRYVRKDEPLATSIHGDENERALIDDVPFELDSDMHDLAAVTLVLANREVDLKGNAPDDLDKLATVHGNPANQDEHCLRRQDEDEPDGSARALADCHAFIHAKTEAALDGLVDLSSGPDPGNREQINVFLELRGPVDADLPRFYVEMGQALHTIQDGFSHTYRSRSDLRKITEILNYADLVGDHFDASRDGPPHSSELDKCQDLDARRQERLQLATQASYELLRAVLTPAATREAKLAAVDDVLGRYLTLDESAGCNAENHWCDAPEADYDAAKGCVCSAGARGSGGGALGGVAALLALWGLRRQRAPLLAHKRKLLGLFGASLTVLTLAGNARAQAATDVSAPPAAPAAVDGNDASPGVVDVSPVSEHREPFPFGGYVSASGAVEKGALAASIGARYRIGSHFLVGLDGEYNPWFSVRNFDMRAGSTNVYAVGVVRFPLRFQRVNLRSTLELGVSRMNFALYGVPKGSVGPFVGFNLLGVDIELSESLYLVVNPAHIALPIPQTTGVPYVYPQYRFTLGLQFGA